MLSKLKMKIKVLILKFKNINKKVDLNIGKGTFISSKAKFIIGINSKINIGENVYISDETRIICHDNAKLIIGDGVYISINSMISSNSSVEIKSNTLIANNVTILDTNKNYKDINKLIRNQGSISKPILINEDCWIGVGSVILSGVTLGRHCIVGANSVVNRSISDNIMVGGIPAKKLRDLNLGE